MVVNVNQVAKALEETARAKKGTSTMTPTSATIPTLVTHAFLKAFSCVVRERELSQRYRGAMLCLNTQWVNTSLEWCDGKLEPEFN